MKANLGKWGIIVLLCILGAGCSSIRARTAAPENEWTVFPGVQQDVKELDEIFSGARPDPAWINGMVTSMLIIDLPFSTIFDTLVAPYDLYRIYTPHGSAEESSTLPPGSNARKTGNQK